MEKRQLIIIGAIIVIIAVVAGLLLTSSGGENSSNSKIDILTQGAISENGTIDVKLTNMDGIALKGKTVHVSVSDDKGNTVYSGDATTYANGVANVQISNVSSGEYNLNVTFDGDNNFTGSSISQKLTIGTGVSEEVEDNSTSQDDAVADTTDSSSQSSSSYSSSQSSSYRSSSSSSSQSYDDSSDDSGYIDENGNAVDTYIDENGKEVVE